VFRMAHSIRIYFEVAKQMKGHAMCKVPVSYFRGMKRDAMKDDVEDEI